MDLMSTSKPLKTDKIMTKARVPIATPKIEMAVSALMAFLLLGENKYLRAM
tara:strand:- start:3881 stop:4033 length:153 start_codon:yes stop_codon:yes gene_type:complete